MSLFWWGFWHVRDSSVLELTKTNTKKADGWYVSLHRVVVDEKGQILLPWMTSIMMGNGNGDGNNNRSEVVAQLPSDECDDCNLQVGDAVRLVVQRVSQGSITVSLSGLRLNRFPSDFEVPLALGQIGGLNPQVHPSACGKYNLQILTDRRTHGMSGEQAEAMEWMQNSFLVAPRTSLLHATAVATFPRQALDLKARRQEQDLQLVQWHLERARGFLQEKSLVEAAASFTEVLRIDPNNVEATQGIQGLHPRKSIADKPRQRKQNDRVDAELSPGQVFIACPGCGAGTHSLDACPYFVCPKCHTWGHNDASICPSHQLPPVLQRGDPLPVSSEQWEALLNKARPEDIAVWRPRERSFPVVAAAVAAAAPAPNVAPALRRSRSREAPPRRGDVDSSRDRTCQNCGVMGHVSSSCPKPRSKGKGNSGDRPRQQDEQGRFIPTCHECGDVGHIRPDCPRRQRRVSPSPAEERGRTAQARGGRALSPASSASYRRDSRRRSPSPRGRRGRTPPPRSERSPSPRKRGRDDFGDRRQHHIAPTPIRRSPSIDDDKPICPA